MSNRYRDRIRNDLNGDAASVDPAVRRALHGLASEMSSADDERERRTAAAEALARDAVDALAAVKGRVTTIAGSLATTILGAAILAALRLT